MVKASEEHQTLEGTGLDHYLVYHNPDTMGYDVRTIEGFSIVTTRPVGKAIGCRVWLITGRGTPRSYARTHTFIAETLETDIQQTGVNRVSASTGIKFGPEIRIDQLSWFPDFQRTMGNFGFGFQRIADERFITALSGLTSPTRAKAEAQTVRRRPRNA